MRLSSLHKVSLLLLIAGCSNKQEASGVKSYFDISGFFSSEAASLHNEGATVLKTVIQNGKTEQKNITNINWKTELELFSNSDINKPAWDKSYKVSTTPYSTEYKALDAKLRTRKIRIEKKADGKAKHIYIQNEVNNMLYSTTEELHYYPDSLYEIQKSQTVLILGDNNYKITGSLKNK
ncbi:hypothetical protein [Desertivirga brevis]|uniref:hypothetical protein n=1 Tax=Desertivirga brevis TaxID=2810310 RepID=UPI001A979BFD|nr:hypothetical protein [Pedobacter sp. SYSU D00873]